MFPKSGFSPQESLPVVPGSINTPSTTTNGCVLLLLMDEFPLMRILELDWGPLAPWFIITPATLPCSAFTTLALLARVSSAPLTSVTEEDSFLASLLTPKPVTTTSDKAFGFADKETEAAEGSEAKNSFGVNPTYETTNVDWGLTVMA